MIKWLIIPWMIAWAILFNKHLDRKRQKRWEKRMRDGDLFKELVKLHQKAERKRKEIENARRAKD